MNKLSTFETKDIINVFYVYMYVDEHNIPFYVGKGSGQRFQPSRHRDDRQPALYNKLRKIGLKNVRVHFVNKDLVEKQALAWEVYWIRHIGRKDQGKGPLLNLTDGGEGSSQGKNSYNPSYQRARYHANPTKYRGWIDTYHTLHRDEIRQYKMQYAQDNKESIKQYMHDWLKANRKKQNAYQRERRRKIRNSRNIDGEI